MKFFIFLYTIVSFLRAEPGILIQPWNRVDLGDSKEVTFNWVSSIVKVYDKKYAGNGLFISPKHILTAHHVISKMKCSDVKLEVLSSPPMATIKTPQKRKYVCKKYILEDENLDIAIIEIKPFYSPHFVSLQENFTSFKPDKVFLAGYYNSDFLWISKDCAFTSMVKESQNLSIQYDSIVRVYPPGTAKVAICPGEPGISGSVLMGSIGEVYIPMGVYSVLGTLQREIKVKSNSTIMDDGGLGQKIIDTPTYKVLGNVDGASHVGVFPALSEPNWKAHKDIWQEVLEASQEKP